MTISCFITFRKDKYGNVFPSLSSKGKFIPLKKAEDEIYYNIKIVDKDINDDGIPVPTNDFLLNLKEHLRYDIDAEGFWVDTRDDYIQKHIVRVKGVKHITEAEPKK